MSKMSLRAARVDAGFTMRDVAERLNVNENTVSAWERGRSDPRAKQVSEMLKMYGRKFEDIDFSCP